MEKDAYYDNTEASWRERCQEERENDIVEQRWAESHPAPERRDRGSRDRLADRLRDRRWWRAWWTIQASMHTGIEAETRLEAARASGQDARDMLAAARRDRR